MKQPPGPNFIIKDLPSVVILKITGHGLKHSLCCFNKYNWCLCTCISKLYILLLTCLINLSETCIILPELFWIKHKLDFSVMKLGPEVLPLVSFIYLGEISVLSLFMEFWMVWKSCAYHTFNDYLFRCSLYLLSSFVSIVLQRGAMLT